jgi:hypothetical protein
MTRRQPYDTALAWERIKNGDVHARIAEDLGTTESAIYELARRARQRMARGLPGPSDNPRIDWSDEEDDFLRAQYLHMGNMTLSEQLGEKWTPRSPAAVSRRLERLELIRPKTWRSPDHRDARAGGWSDDDIEFMSENYYTMSDEEMGAALNRSARAIQEKRQEVGLYRIAALPRDTDPTEDMEKIKAINEAFVRDLKIEWARGRARQRETEGAMA